MNINFIKKHPKLRIDLNPIYTKDSEIYLNKIEDILRRIPDILKIQHILNKLFSSNEREILQNNKLLYPCIFETEEIDEIYGAERIFLPDIYPTEIYKPFIGFCELNCRIIRDNRAFYIRIFVSIFNEFEINWTLGYIFITKDYNLFTIVMNEIYKLRKQLSNYLSTLFESEYDYFLIIKQIEERCAPLILYKIYNYHIINRQVETRILENIKCSNTITTNKKILSVNKYNENCVINSKNYNNEQMRLYLKYHKHPCNMCLESKTNPALLSLLQNSDICSLESTGIHNINCYNNISFDTLMIYCRNILDYQYLLEKRVPPHELKYWKNGQLDSFTITRRNINQIFMCYNNKYHPWYYICNDTLHPIIITNLKVIDKNKTPLYVNIRIWAQNTIEDNEGSKYIAGIIFITKNFKLLSALNYKYYKYIEERHIHNNLREENIKMKEYEKYIKRNYDFKNSWKIFNPERVAYIHLKLKYHLVSRFIK